MYRERILSDMTPRCPVPFWFYSHIPFYCISEIFLLIDISMKLWDLSLLSFNLLSFYGCYAVCFTWPFCCSLTNTFFLIFPSRSDWCVLESEFLYLWQRFFPHRNTIYFTLTRMWIRMTYLVYSYISSTCIIFILGMSFNFSKLYIPPL